MAKDIYPIFDTILSKSDKEMLLNQKGVVIWLVGLSGSGKSTIARALETRLHNEGFLCKLLDGDNLRTGLNSNLGFNDEDRHENIRRTSEVAHLFSNSGVVTLCSFITPTEEFRNMARGIIGDSYIEVFINCPLEVCEQRDVKGIYAKARKGEIKNFTGIDAPFEAPRNASIELDTNKYDLEYCVEALYNGVIDKIK